MQVKNCQSLYIVLVLILTLCLFWATTSVTYAQDLKGAYLGYTVGIADYDAGLSHDWDTKLSISDDFAYGVIGGYGRVKDNTYYGVEVNFDYNTADYRWDGDKSNDFESIDIEESYGISARLGYVVNNWIVYGLIGGQRARIDAKVDYGTKFSKYSDEESFNGLRVGAGVEYNISGNIFFRYQYSYTKFNREVMNDNDIKLYIDHARNFQLVYGARF